MEEIYLSVIIPCYNESENIKRNVLDQVNKFMKSKKFSWEVIVSDDGSTDSSVWEINKRSKMLKSFRLIKNLHGGKPSALWFGTKAALGKYVLFCDMDQSTPISELDKLMPYIRENYKAVIGSRGYTRKNFPVYRRIGSFIFSTLRKLIILPEINDTQCGFKLFKRDIVLKYFPLIEYFKYKKDIVGWKVTSWDVEFLYLLKKKGINIKEVLVNWRDVDVSKDKKGISRYINESYEMLMQVLRVKSNDIKKIYDRS